MNVYVSYGGGGGRINHLKKSYLTGQLLIFWGESLNQGSMNDSLDYIHTEIPQTHVHTQKYTHIIIIVIWGTRDAWSNAPQLLSDNYFVGS